MLSPFATVFLPVSLKNDRILRSGGAKTRRIARRTRAISRPTSETKRPAVPIQTANPTAEPK